MLLIRSGITVEVSTFVIVVLLDVHEGGGALSDTLEAAQSTDIAVRVDIDVLDGRRVHEIEESFFVGHLLIEHLELLLILLDADLYAMNQYLGIDHFLRCEGYSCLFVSDASDWTGDLLGWLGNDLCDRNFCGNKSDRSRVQCLFCFGLDGFNLFRSLSIRFRSDIKFGDKWLDVDDRDSGFLFLRRAGGCFL